MAETNLLINPQDATSIFINTQLIEIHKKIYGDGVRLRLDTHTGKVYIIANATADDHEFPPREFVSLDAARVFLRLTEGDP